MQVALKSRYFFLPTWAFVDNNVVICAAAALLCMLSTRTLLWSLAAAGCCYAMLPR